MSISKLPVELITSVFQHLNLDEKLTIKSLDQTYSTLLIPAIWKVCPIATVDKENVDHLNLLFKYGRFIQHLELSNFDSEDDVYISIVNWCPNLKSLKVVFKDDVKSSSEVVNKDSLDPCNYFTNLQKRCNSMLSNFKLNRTLMGLNLRKLVKLQLTGSLKAINHYLRSTDLTHLNCLTIEIKGNSEQVEFESQLTLMKCLSGLKSLKSLQMDLYQLFYNGTLTVDLIGIFFSELEPNNLKRLTLNLGVLPKHTNSNILLIETLSVVSLKFPSLVALNLKFENCYSTIDYYHLLHYVNDNFALNQFNCIGTDLNKTHILESKLNLRFTGSLPLNVSLVQAFDQTSKHQIVKKESTNFKLKLKQVNNIVIEPLDLTKSLLKEKSTVFSYFKSWFI